MEEAFKSWRATAPPKTQATIDALNEDDTVLIHIIRGKVENGESRGASSGLASNPDSRQQCQMHPIAPRVSKVRKWDVIYDEQLHRKREHDLGFKSPIEALLQHEIMGHIAPILRDPLLLRRPSSENENYAIEEENAYRRENGWPLVPWRMPDGTTH